ncbi:MAG: preprotein translocase subunit YajC [Acidimicrobiales bacterium]|nr:preprotein translocase subunit YajC [Acidimicrobiales bacterium]
MHHLYSLLLQSTSPTTAGKSKSSGSSYVSLFIIVAIFVVAYFVFLRPRQQRMRQQQTAARQISIGDEVMSAGGIFGRVVAMDNDQVEVEVAPGVVMTFLRKAISPRQQTGPGPSAGYTATDTPAEEPWDMPDGSEDGHEGPPPAPGDPRDKP